MKHSNLFELTSLCLFFYIFTINTVQAQFSGPDEVLLYCKDGSKYKGKLIEETEDYTSICVFQKDTIVISEENIRIKRYGKNRLYYNKLKTHLTKGRFWSLNYGLNIITNPASGTTLSREFQLHVGWRLNKRLSVAGSLGFAGEEYKVSGFWLYQEMASLSAYGRYYLTDKRIRPFVYSQVGYTKSFGNTNWPGADFIHESEGGLSITNGLGIHFPSKKGYRIHLSLGYHLQRVKGNVLFWDTLENEVNLDYKYWLQKPMLRVGMEF